jgi:hypothetical protein
VPGEEVVLLAEKDDQFAMPDGSVYEVIAAAADTGGEFVEMQFMLPPGSVAPPQHVHSQLTEEYEVLEGPAHPTRPAFLAIAALRPLRQLGSPI